MDSLNLSIKDPLILVWVVLVGLTVISFSMGAGHSVGGMSERVATVLVLLVAFAKAGAVASYFMEVREAVPALRGTVAACIGGAALTVVGLYLWA